MHFSLSSLETCLWPQNKIIFLNDENAVEKAQKTREMQLKLSEPKKEPKNSHGN